jgi:hypothetical protein
VKVLSSRRVATSQSRTVESCWADTTLAPSGENATAFTDQLPGGVNVLSSRPLATSHSFSVSSLLPDSARRAAAVGKATDLTSMDELELDSPT